MFHKVRCWIYDPNRFYFFTGANDFHTSCAREELEDAGIIYAMNEIYNYEPGVIPRESIGLGSLNILQRLKVRFIIWKGGCCGRLWYTI